MDNISVTELRKLKQDLDLFETPAYPAALLTKGIYPALAVSPGNLLWGFHILRTAIDLNLETLDCRLFPALSRTEGLIVALGLEDRAGKYSWEEKELFLPLLESGDGIHPELVHLLEGRNDMACVQKYRQYTLLSPPLKSMVKTKVLNLKTALEIAGLPEESLAFFLAADKEHHFSFSETRIFLISYFEVCRRDELSSTAALELMKQLMSSPAPLEDLKKLRYPRLNRMEKQFSDFQAAYLKGSGIELKAPEYFEGSQYTLSFSFTPGNLARKIKTITTIQEHLDELEGLL